MGEREEEVTEGRKERTGERRVDNEVSGKGRRGECSLRGLRERERVCISVSVCMYSGSNNYLILADFVGLPTYKEWNRV